MEFQKSMSDFFLKNAVIFLLCSLNTKYREHMMEFAMDIFGDEKYAFLMDLIGLDRFDSKHMVINFDMAMFSPVTSSLTFNK